MSNLKEIYDLSDPVTQALKIIEELDEYKEVLLEALTHDDLHNLPEELKNRIVDESTDVYITNGQSPYIFNIDNDKFIKRKKFKFKRTKDRLTS